MYPFLLNFRCTVFAYFPYILWEACEITITMCELLCLITTRENIHWLPLKVYEIYSTGGQPYAIITYLFFGNYLLFVIQQLQTWRNREFPKWYKTNITYKRSALNNKSHNFQVCMAGFSKGLLGWDTVWSCRKVPKVLFLLRSWRIRPSYWQWSAYLNLML